jgi:hypothetical protein
MQNDIYSELLNPCKKCGSSNLRYVENACSKILGDCLYISCSNCGTYSRQRSYKIYGNSTKILVMDDWNSGYIEFRDMRKIKLDIVEIDKIQMA